jgi:biofilm PGA synthesis N-glycosyltransferase PgaC
MRKGTAVGRSIVLILIFMTLLLTTVDAVIAKYFDGDPFDTEPLVFRLPGFSIDVVTGTPPIDFLAISIIGIFLVGIGSVILEMLGNLRLLNPEYLDLDVYLRQGQLNSKTIIAVVPAHNEADNLPMTLPALMRQTRPPDRIIVVADNCTDETVSVARSLGAEVIETTDNRDRKAGALNQAFSQLRNSETSSDLYLVLDADTSLSPQFLDVAERYLAGHDEIFAIGGLFYGEPGHGLIGQLQRNEYFRYQLQIKHRRGRVFVLTGTASVFRAQALLDVTQARGTLIPGIKGEVYDTASITEDNELTLALKSLGFGMISPQECTVETELMPTWKALWTQRKRWQRGALDNLAEYGVTTATARYWGQQIGIAYGVVALFTAYFFLIVATLAMDHIYLYTFWLVVTALFIIDRVGTVWSGGWSARLVAAPLVIEVAYSFFLQFNFISSLFDLVRRKKQKWGHLPSTAGVDQS